MVTGFRLTLAKFAVFTAIALVLMLLLYNTMANRVPGSTRTYDAEFTHVSGLSKGDDVRVAGVRVGKVSDIEIIDDGARVEFELVEEQPLLRNTEIVMRYQNLLGQRYLSLVQGERRGASLAEGSTVPRSRTSPGFDLTELLNGFRPLLEVLQPGEVNDLVSSVIKVLQGEGGTIEQLLDQTAELTTYVADRDELIGRVLRNLTPVLREMSSQGDALRATVKELRALMTGLAKDRRQIGRSVSGLSTLITETSTFLEELREPATLNARLFRQVTASLDDNRALLTRALKAFGISFGALGRATSYENGANVHLCTMWVVTALGKVNLAGTSSGGPWSKVCR